ncbi:nucleotidyltransferase family protein [Thiohalophilus sp.]|uniref:nucleotidyltransferase family protein n=1 Tax=Thiohalophilus sp. TaxID=3028392 RepID=UPI002ACEFF7F|nr:nucleotidyltransferase domain-containing protein [Thiohalophilus sp.]MDZ7803632.1 nucleotidyltransferase domain-containing protein [Thiohalophilus sp.]
MNLKPQDILVLLKLVAMGDKPWSFSQLANELSMSPSEVHAAVKRTLAARLAVKTGENIRPNTRNLEEFLLHGIQYVFIPERGEMNRGIPTAHAAEPMAKYMVSDNEPPPVWPESDGELRGESFSPLYKSAPKAARKDPRLYELLALVDAIRGGRAREREIAKKALKKQLAKAGQQMEHGMAVHGTISATTDLNYSQEDLLQLVKRHHIRHLSLFGSAARGGLRPDSDIDLLVEFEEGKEPSLGGMVEIQDAFEALFGRRVDVATPSILNNPYRRRAIEKDMKELYAA